jgi:hypothetical protein
MRLAGGPGRVTLTEEVGCHGDEHRYDEDSEAEPAD